MFNNLVIKLKYDNIKVILPKYKEKNQLLRLDKSSIFDTVNFYENIQSSQNSR